MAFVSGFHAFDAEELPAAISDDSCHERTARGILASIGQPILFVLARINGE